MPPLVPSRHRRLVTALPLASLALLAATACIFRSVTVRELDGRAPVAVSTPVKAHLLDGSTVVFAAGAEVRGDSVLGRGARWLLGAVSSTAVAGVPLDSVAAMETFDPKIDTRKSVLASAAVPVGIVAGVAIFKAIFGSCPTIYTDSVGTPRLEAESFSYSIAPLYERRDVDPLRTRPSADGSLVLEVRNEALETHYINHLEVVAVAHRPGEVVLPGREDRPLALGGLVAPARATDRAGRDVRPALLADDALVFATDSLVLARASAADLWDHVELTFDVAPTTAAGDSAALVLTLRNSLLNTVLLYDVMLADAGAHALDWIGRDLERIDDAVALGHWYGSRMGMRVEAWRDGRWAQVASVSDVGPIAWRRLAVPMARVPGERRVRLRLSYVADQWRIDRAALATSVRAPAVRRVSVTRITDAAGAVDSAAAARLRAPDKQYVITEPGHRFFARFDVGAARAGEALTTLVAAQGYYTEWIRGDWIRAAEAPRRFVPGDTAIVVAMRRWQQKQHEMERQFEATKIPVR